MPPRLRKVLKLRGGVGLPAALSPQAVAARLHMSIRRLSRLEVLAMRRLLRLAQGGCGGAVIASVVVPFLSGFEPPLGGPGAGISALGGVGAVREAAPAPPTSEHAAPLSGVIPGLSAIKQPAEGVEIAVLFVAGLAGLIMAGLLFGDELAFALRTRRGGRLRR